jgi:peptidyl-prolyl cis-trans isomerase B (cyclophilin B)
VAVPQVKRRYVKRYKMRSIGVFIIAVMVMASVGCSKNQNYAKPTKDVADTFPIKAKPVKENPQSAESSGPYAIIHTTAGDITVLLYSEEAPKAVENFIALAESGYYEDSLFRYVVRESIVQGGTPADGNETSSFGEAFEDEFSDNLHHFHGALSMANEGINTNESQFFFVASEKIPEDEQLIRANMRMNELVHEGNQELNDKARESTLSEEEIAEFEQKLNQKIQGIKDGIPEEEMKRYQQAVEKYMEVGGLYHLDYSNTVFGQVVKGLNVVDSMSRVLVSAEDRKPKQDIKINSIEIVDNLK